MSGQVVKLRNGGSVAVRTGIVRGAGPSGPMGPPGPRGLTGAIGAKGVAGSVNDLLSILTQASAVSTASDGWDLLSFDHTADNDLLDVVGYDGYHIKPITTGLYQVTVQVQFEPRTGSGSSGVAGASRRLQLVETATAGIVGETSIAAAPSEPTIVSLSMVAQLRSDSTYHVLAFSDDSTAILATNRHWSLVRVGSGPAGIPGPLGPQGGTGAQGPKGDTGSAGTGYASFNAIASGGNSDATPTGTMIFTADQAVPIPGPTQPPMLTYFFRQLAQYLERRVVRIYTSGTDRATKRGANAEAGNLSFLTDTQALTVRHVDASEAVIAQIDVSVGTPSLAVGAARSTYHVWFQI